MQFFNPGKTIFLVFAIIISFPACLFATDYYVSNNGSDDNTGTSSSAAWKTIEKVNATNLQPGDRVLFESGGVWRETLVVSNSGAKNKYIVYTRYGNGINPQIFGSDKAEDWSSTATSNVWQSATTLENLSEEYYAGRIFFVSNDSVIWGNYVGGVENLSQEFDYAVSGSNYYIFSTSNPNTHYDAIEVTQRDYCLSMPSLNPQSYIEIDGVDFRFGRLAGFDAGYPEIRGCTDLIFRNCTIGYIGAKGSPAAYGIAAFHSNFLVEHCKITDCGRRGISVNLYVMDKPASDVVSLNNIIVRNNLFKRGYHTTSLDLSLQMSNTDRITNVYYYNNIVDDSEFQEICDGCTSNQVFFQNGDGSFLDNIYVVGNLFIGASARNILFAGGKSNYIWNNTIVGHNQSLTISPYANVSWNSDDAIIDYRNNILYDNLPDNDLQNHGLLIYNYDAMFKEKDYNLYYSLFPKTDRNFSAHKVNNTGGMGYWNTLHWDDYRSENTLFENHSPRPTDPKFMDYAQQDFRLADTSSPAAGVGIATPWVIVTDPFGVKDTINKCDVNGKMFNSMSWDIGAYSIASTTGIDPKPINSKRSFKLYPNPAKDYCYLSADTVSAGAYSIQLSDIQGRMVYKSKNYTDEVPVKVSLDYISAGIYLVKFFNESAYMESKKLVVIK
jgi:hypothetical protein